MVLIERPQIMTFEQSEKAGAEAEARPRIQGVGLDLPVSGPVPAPPRERETGFDWRCDVVAVNVGIDLGLRGPRQKSLGE
jgi:hypothetical protein